MYQKGNNFKPTSPYFHIKKVNKLDCLKTMAEKEQEMVVDPMISDFNVKIRDIEEKQNIVKDRVLLIGENLVSTKEETIEELAEIKTKIFAIEEDLNKIKLALQRTIESQQNLARKAELEILERQFKMFQPLDLARISDVEKIVKDILKKQQKK